MTIKTIAASTLLVLAVAACGSSTATPSPTAAGSPITVRDFKFDTPDVTVSGKVVLTVTNAGPTIHDLTIRDDAGMVLGETADLKPNASETLTADLPAGVYTIFCAVPGHESLGIKGTLTVTK
jgi:uncharacterized cupredoxin-like copper-binding protein